MLNEQDFLWGPVRDCSADGLLVARLDVIEANDGKLKGLMSDIPDWL